MSRLPNHTHRDQRLECISPTVKGIVMFTDYVEHERPQTKTSIYDGEFSFKLFAIIALMHLAALCGLFWPWSAIDIVILGVLHVFFCLSISIGYHRYLAHGAITPVRWFGRVLAFVGNLNFEGGPLFWAAAHRAHHKSTESFGDPHTAIRGFWWSHVAWMFYSEPNGFSLRKSPRLIPDLLRDPYLKFIEKYSLELNLAVLGLAALGFMLIHRIDIFFWAFPIRIVTVWHATWAINSVMHGARFDPRKTPKGIRNLRLFNLLSAGEGSHLNHHERPIYTHGRTWTDFELVGPLILLLHRCRFIKSIRR